MRSLAITLLTALAVPFIPAVGANHWPQFRGVNGQGIADPEKPPIEFSQRQNLLWKTALPPGHSSPVIWDNYLFLTAQEGNRLTTLCFLRKTGALLWKREGPEHTLAQVHRFKSPAASTPVTDCRRVYSYFGSFGVVAYDFSGKESWRVSLPSPPTQYGAASSPIIWHDKLILQQDGNSTNSALVFT